MKKKVNFISWLRFFAVICILICHLVQTSEIPIVRIYAQFFNIGVELFILISGFCFGLQGRITDVRKWFIKRIKRIYVPYELFVVLLVIIYYSLDENVDLLSWLWCVSGLMVSIKGITHAWFVAVILICYCVTPILAIFCEKGYGNKNLLATLILLPSVAAFIPNYTLAAYLPHIFFYGCGYLIGANYNEIVYSRDRVVKCVLLTIASGGVRVVGRIFLDGTVWYDNIIVIYTQYMIGISIFVFFAMVLNVVQPKRICDFICRISFEVYLCHYMFIVGPVSLMGRTSLWILDCIAVIIVSVTLATVMNFVNRKVLAYLK